MADTYRHFCAQLELADGDEAWWRKELLIGDQLPEDDERSGDDEWDGFPKFGWEIDTPGAIFFFDNDGTSSVDQVLMMVQRFAVERRPQLVWTMEWAEVTKPSRVDGFGGGVCVVTATEMSHVSTTELKDKMAEGARDPARMIRNAVHEQLLRDVVERIHAVLPGVVETVAGGQQALTAATLLKMAFAGRLKPEDTARAHELIAVIEQTWRR